MATVDKLRNDLIDKILTIRNKDILIALNKLVSSGSTDADIIELTDEQRELLQMSDDDIKNDRLISQEAMDKRNRQWLNEM
ncbi:MAG: hypothetical protein RI562_11565 [Salibacter sp.]|uniref:hypothetical protein n=1 Tax=Salibacter sp. TaxID=2010995 RepID=UPI0028702D48|nr:hypothetical protein [Salibacter sp.]MDR9399690.1 hypothetical protein [Salibacter sp.]